MLQCLETWPRNCKQSRLKEIEEAKEEEEVEEEWKGGGGGTKYDRYNGEAHIFTLEPTALPTLQAPSEPN